MEQPRKTHTSTAVKLKYLNKHYVQYNVRIKPELDEQIKGYLTREGISKSEFLARAIDALTPKGDGKS